MADPLPVVKGTLDVLVLKALSAGPLHGFEVVSWLEQRSRGQLEVEDSAVYQALYRLEQRTLIEASWGVTENNRKARYYESTAAGRAWLKAQTRQWLDYSKLVTSLLTTSPRSS